MGLRIASSSRGRRSSRSTARSTSRSSSSAVIFVAALVAARRPLAPAALRDLAAAGSGSSASSSAGCSGTSRASSSATGSSTRRACASSSTSAPPPAHASTSSRTAASTRATRFRCGTRSLALVSWFRGVDPGSVDAPRAVAARSDRVARRVEAGVAVFGSRGAGRQCSCCRSRVLLRPRPRRRLRDARAAGNGRPPAARTGRARALLRCRARPPPLRRSSARSHSSHPTYALFLLPLAARLAPPAEWRESAPVLVAAVLPTGSCSSGCGRSSTRRVSHDPGPPSGSRALAPLPRPARRRRTITTTGSRPRCSAAAAQSPSRRCSWSRSRRSRWPRAGPGSRSAGALIVLLLDGGAVALRPLLGRGVALAVAARRRLHAAAFAFVGVARAARALAARPAGRPRRRHRLAAPLARRLRLRVAAGGPALATWIALVGGIAALVLGSLKRFERRPARYGLGAAAIACLRAAGVRARDRALEPGAGARPARALAGTRATPAHGRCRRVGRARADRRSYGPSRRALLVVAVPVTHVANRRRTTRSAVPGSKALGAARTTGTLPRATARHGGSAAGGSIRSADVRAPQGRRRSRRTRSPPATVR